MSTHFVRTPMVLCALLLHFPLLALSKDPAWNGQVTPGSTSTRGFSSFYVPPGAKAFGSDSKMIHYAGVWTTSYCSSSPGGTSRSTYERNASVTLSFDGRTIEVFGSTGPKPGCSDVYLNGMYQETIRPWSNATYKGQRLFWRYDLAPTKHALKMVNCGATDVAAFVFSQGLGSTSLDASKLPPRNLAPGSACRETAEAKWGLLQKGSTGVNAMQLTIVSPTHALIVDKVEHNPLTIDGHPAWGSLYDLTDHSVRPLRMLSNSFCASGSFLGNGTLVMVGGNPVVADHAASADFGDTNGLQSIRMFGPCSTGAEDACTVREDPTKRRLASPRWYSTSVRLVDGSLMIIGGSRKGGWINNSTVNNPTIEYFPPKNIHGSRGLPIHSLFLERTLPSNLFPTAILLPDNTLFIAANRDAIIYDWKSNTERRLPSIPNGVRITYPFSSGAALLPLCPENNYTPEVLICGGSRVDDTLPSYQISSQDPASTQCARLILSEEGISRGWEVEHMPQARIMPDLVALPNGQYIIVNGAGSGMAGYGNVQHQVGQSNADNPRLTPVLYDPKAEHGHRFCTHGLPTSNIPRMYHSVASLTPIGSVMIAGSNPNLDRSELPFGTEYRVEWLFPPYMSQSRPRILDDNSIGPVHYAKPFEVRVESLHPEELVQVALIDLGYVTHSIHTNARYVYLVVHSLKQGRIRAVGPPSQGIYPPGPGWLCVLANGVPSPLVQVMVGDGSGPPVDNEALANALSHSARLSADEGSGGSE